MSTDLEETPGNVLTDDSGNILSLDLAGGLLPSYDACDQLVVRRERVQNFSCSPVGPFIPPPPVTLLPFFASSEQQLRARVSLARNFPCSPVGDFIGGTGFFFYGIGPLVVLPGPGSS